MSESKRLSRSVASRFWIAVRWGRTTRTVRPFDLRRREARMVHVNGRCIGLTVGVSDA